MKAKDVNKDLASSWVLQSSPETQNQKLRKETSRALSLFYGMFVILHKSLSIRQHEISVCLSVSISCCLAKQFYQ